MRVLIYILCLLPVLAHAQQADTLVQSLADPDSTKRAAAEIQLTRMGLEARPALVVASRSPDPAIAPAAARVLMALPWSLATDPIQVQQVLRDYGELPEAGRIAIVGQLARMSAFQGLPAMLRLIVEDPSEDVCWSVVTALTRATDGVASPVTNPIVQEQIRKLNPKDERSAALVLGAYGWIYRDRPRVLSMLRRAIDTESARPSYDDGNLDFAFDRLAETAVADGKLDTAADLRRVQSTRIGVTRASFPTPVYQLFALHGRFGPLKGLDNDVQVQAQYLGHPMVIYALGQAYDRAGRTFEALACRQAAFAAGLSASSRDEAGEFLVTNGWVDLARREFHSIVGSDDLSFEMIRIRADANLHLASLSNRDDADAAAIEQFKLARDFVPLYAEERRQHFNTLYTAEILWRQARIALQKGNPSEANARFDELMDLKSDDTDVIQNSYPMLLSLNRRDDALKLFQLGYERLKRSMDTEPDRPVWWNDLAWLCSRCDQKLEESLELSKRAVAADPDNSSYIDTLAEVYFRMGQAAEAVKLETRALQIEPGDIFMTKQIERFRASNRIP